MTQDATTSTAEPREGIEATFKTLVRCRPDRKITGFAPGGKVRTHQYGANRSVFRGRGMEFDEARIYQPGDDARAIDWRVSARKGEMHTKLFHEERERPVLILADLRGSMQFGTRVQFKSVLAAKIAAALAWTGVDGGDRVGGFVTTPMGARPFAASRNTPALMGFLKAIAEGTKLVDPAETSASNKVEVPLRLTIERLRKVARPGTLVFIISDFADFDDETARALKRLSLHAHVTNIMIHDPLEEALPRGNQRITDGKNVLSLAELGRDALTAHANALVERREQIERLSRQRGMAFLDIPTTGSVADALYPHRKGKGAVRPAKTERAA